MWLILTLPRQREYRGGTWRFRITHRLRVLCALRVRKTACAENAEYAEAFRTRSVRGSDPLVYDREGSVPMTRVGKITVRNGFEPKRGCAFSLPLAEQRGDGGVDAVDVDDLGLRDRRGLERGE